jgi:hypothetical protein
MKCFAMFAGIALSAGASVVAAQAPSGPGAATLLPGDRSIEIAGESGKESEIRTIRFQVSGEPAIAFLPHDLRRKTPEPQYRIDSGQVRVTPVAATKVIPGFSTFELSVVSLPEHYGRYDGEIEIFVDGKSREKLPLVLNILPPASLDVKPQPPQVTLSTTSGSSLPFAGRLVPAARPTVAKQLVAVPGLPEGVEINSVAASPLLSSTGNGQFQGTFNIKKERDGIFINVDASQASADKYTAVAELVMAETGRKLALPIEVSVRVGPMMVLILIITGILLGRLAKFMTDRGNVILAAKRQVEEFIERADAVPQPYRNALDETRNDLRQLLRTARFAAVAAAVESANKRAELVEYAAKLGAWARDAGNKDADARLGALQGALTHSTQFQQIKDQLDGIAAMLTPPRAAQEAQNQRDDDAAAAGRTTQGGVTRGEVLVWLTEKSWWIIETAAIVILAFVGFEALYVNGSATFGANPVSDYLTAVIWGLSADVAGRTITSLGRAGAPA